MKIAYRAAIVAAAMWVAGCAGMQRAKHEKLAAERAIQTAEADYRAAAAETAGRPQSQVRLAENDLKAAKKGLAERRYVEAREGAARSSRLAKQAQQAAIETKRREAAEQKRLAEQRAKPAPAKKK